MVNIFSPYCKNNVFGFACQHFCCKLLFNDIFFSQILLLKSDGNNPGYLKKRQGSVPGVPITDKTDKKLLVDFQSSKAIFLPWFPVFLKIN